MSRFSAHAAKRNRRKQLLARAPRVSPTIELRYIRDVRRVVLALHGEIRRAIEPQLRQDDLEFWHRLAQKARAAAEAFRRVAIEAARQLEVFSRSEAVRTLGDLASDLASDVPGFVEGFAADAVTKLTGLLTGSVDAAQESTLVGEEQGTDTLKNILEAWVSKAVNSASNSITQGSAELNRTRQVDAGVDGYYWISRRDGRTRAEHRDLDNGQVYSWDDPPLHADESDSGEPCHPGDDYGCRCMPSPAIIPAQAAQEQEREAA